MPVLSALENSFLLLSGLCFLAGFLASKSSPAITNLSTSARSSTPLQARVTVNPLYHSVTVNPLYHRVTVNPLYHRVTVNPLSHSDSKPTVSNALNTSRGPKKTGEPFHPMTNSCSYSPHKCRYRAVPKLTSAPV